MPVVSEAYHCHRPLLLVMALRPKAAGRKKVGNRMIDTNLATGASILVFIALIIVADAVLRRLRTYFHAQHELRVEREHARFLRESVPQSGYFRDGTQVPKEVLRIPESFKPSPRPEPIVVEDRPKRVRKKRVVVEDHVVFVPLYEEVEVVDYDPAIVVETLDAASYEAPTVVYEAPVVQYVQQEAVYESPSYQPTYSAPDYGGSTSWGSSDSGGGGSSDWSSSSSDSGGGGSSDWS